ncbi:MAG: diguanylate cyclase [Defluviitaleaceae bacterium]|nr:diguanylate cyclase [Defluviitaleaceae bacterium]
MEKVKNSILVVDDEAMNITALSHILKQDYTVYVEKDGQGCIEAARELMPDLILLDIIMPAMNGFEVIATLKKDEATRDIPVIFVTGLNNAQDEEMGFVLGAADYISKPFSASVVKLRVKSQIQIINQMRLIHNISITDALTGIGNRRYFYTQLEQEWQRSMRQQTTISFIMLDIDHFKTYNDTHGHLQGDMVLKETAQIIKGSLARAIDKAARWGGEEFAIILPDTTMEGAKLVAERIRETVEAHAFVIDPSTTTSITVSIGINCNVPKRGADYTLENFVSDADKALYYAKGTGRNRVCVFTEMTDDTFPNV